MFCEKCGTEMPEGAVFCGKCGNKKGTATINVKVDKGEGIVKKLNVQVIITIIASICMIFSLLFLPFANLSEHRGGPKKIVDYEISILEEAPSKIEDIYETIKIFTIILFMIIVANILLVLTKRLKSAGILSICNLATMIIMLMSVQSQWVNYCKSSYSSEYWEYFIEPQSGVAIYILAAFAMIITSWVSVFTNKNK